MNVIVTGTERSGSTFIGQSIARSLQISGSDIWNGTASCHDDKHYVLHRSIPYGLPPIFYNVRDFLKNIPNAHWVITVRDINISEKARHIWPKNEHQRQCESIRAREVIYEIMHRSNYYFLLSYETLMFLGNPYLNKLYNFLNIPVRNRFYPELRDGNKKYLTNPKNPVK